MYFNCTRALKEPLWVLTRTSKGRPRRLLLSCNELDRPPSSILNRFVSVSVAGCPPQHWRVMDMLANAASRRHLCTIENISYVFRGAFYNIIYTLLCAHTRVPDNIIYIWRLYGSCTYFEYPQTSRVGIARKARGRKVTFRKKKKKKKWLGRI